jgi:hypothetical protein
MSTRTSATRYAKALLDVTTSDADAAKVEQDLGAFVALIESNPELRPAQHRLGRGRAHRHGAHRRASAAAARRP